MQADSDEEKPRASRAEASVKPVMLPHTTPKLSGWVEKGVSTSPPSSSSSTTPCVCSLNPPAALPHPSKHPGVSQSGPKRLVATPHVFWPVTQKSLHNLINSVPGKASASTATGCVWPVFSVAIWSQRLSPARHASSSSNSVRARSPRPPCSQLLCGFFQEP